MSHVASARPDAWLETSRAVSGPPQPPSRPPARTRGLKQILRGGRSEPSRSRPPARTRGLKPDLCRNRALYHVASSREDAWIETAVTGTRKEKKKVASSGDAAWIETGGGIREYPYLSEVCVDWNKMSSFFFLFRFVEF